MRDPDPIPQAEEVDAETGEVLNQETSPQEGGTEGAAGQDGEAKPAMTPREAVVDKLMPDVVDGKNVPKLLNALPAAERDLLTDEDVAKLKQASAAAAVKENASG